MTDLLDEIKETVAKVRSRSPRWFFLCRLGLHAWLAWQEPYKLHRSSVWEWQQRKCARCGLVQERQVGYLV